MAGNARSGNEVPNQRSGPLTDHERALIDAAERQPWAWALTAALRRAVEQRGIPTHPHDDAGMLAGMLVGGLR